MEIKELGHIVLYVTNIQKSVHFYRNILGFKEIGEEETKGKGVALFSSGRTHHELLLIEIGGTPKPKVGFEPGLYHFGFKIGDTDEELKNAIQELQSNNVSITGTADHTVTHSIYIEDPDGNEIELYVDVGDDWKTNPGKILSPTKRLNLN